MFEDYYFKTLTYLKIKGISFIDDVDIWENNDFQVAVLDELRNKGYINQNDTSIWLSTKGFDYLRLCANSLPIKPPPIQLKKPYSKNAQTGTGLFRLMWQNAVSIQAIQFFWLPLIVLLIGGIILKLFELM